jgi:hypothetical protein
LAGCRFAAVRIEMQNVEIIIARQTSLPRQALFKSPDQDLLP